MFVESTLCDGWMWRCTCVQCWIWWSRASFSVDIHWIFDTTAWTSDSFSLCCFQWIPAVLMVCFSCFCMSWSFPHGSFVFAHVGDEWWRRQSQVLLLLFYMCYQHPLRKIHINLNLSRFSHPHMLLIQYYVLKTHYGVKKPWIRIRINFLIQHTRVNESKTVRLRHTSHTRCFLTSLSGY